MTTSMNDRDSIVTLFRAVFPEPVMALSGLVLLLLSVPTSAAVIFDDTLLQGQNIGRLQFVQRARGRQGLQMANVRLQTADMAQRLPPGPTKPKSQENNEGQGYQAARAPPAWG